MITWNYRIMKHKNYFALHEVHYENNVAIAYSEKPVNLSIMEDTVKELTDRIKFIADKYEEASKSPILYYGVKFPEECHEP